MGLVNWIFDIYQHQKIGEAKEAAVRAEAAAVRSGGSVDAARLEQALGELALATKTIQRLMVDKGLVSPAEFGEKLRLIDAEDGRVDGKAPI